MAVAPCLLTIQNHLKTHTNCPHANDGVPRAQSGIWGNRSGAYDSVRTSQVISLNDLLKKEKKFSRLRDELTQQRRDLPWEKVAKEYVLIPAQL
jgi:hypothetical protein